MVLVRGIEYYFKNLPENAIREAVTIGSMDVERSMRDYYEKLYIQKTDSGHEYFKSNILAKSLLKTNYQISLIIKIFNNLRIITIHLIVY